MAGKSGTRSAKKRVKRDWLRYPGKEKMGRKGTSPNRVGVNKWQARGARVSFGEGARAG